MTSSSGSSSSGSARDAIPGPGTVTAPAEVARALACPRLVPPPPPDSIGDGPVAALRSSMARFRAGADHAGPRHDVEQALAGLDLVALADLATVAAEELLAGSPGPTGEAATAAGATAAPAPRPGVGPRPTAAPARAPSAAAGAAAEAVARRAPVLAVAAALGCPRTDRGTVADQVEAVVGVIGRGGPTSAEAELAAAALLARFDDHPHGPVAAVSLLYQVVDATAARIRATLAAADAGG
ncbi:MAG: hypothetical protein AAGK32_18965, partial [Actinomycetota bacterium]